MATHDGSPPGFLPTNVAPDPDLIGGLPSPDPPRVVASVGLWEAGFTGFDGEDHTELFYCAGQQPISREEFIDYVKRQRPHKAKRARLRRLIWGAGDLLLHAETVIHRFGLWAGGDGGPDDRPIPGEGQPSPDDTPIPGE